MTPNDHLQMKWPTSGNAPMDELCRSPSQVIKSLASKKFLPEQLWKPGLFLGEDLLSLQPFDRG